MKVQVLLADKGTPNLQQGTLNLLNVGWSQTGLRPAGPMGLLLTPPFAVAVFFEVDHHHCNHPIDLVLSLVTEDGTPVEVPGPAGPQQMRISQQITVSSPAGMPIGAPGVGNSLVEIVPGLPLAPGGYQWRATLAGEEGDDWNASFRVQLPPQAVAVFGGPPGTAPESDG